MREEFHIVRLSVLRVRPTMHAVPGLYLLHLHLRPLPLPACFSLIANVLYLYDLHLNALYLSFSGFMFSTSTSPSSTTSMAMSPSSSLYIHRQPLHHGRRSADVRHSAGVLQWGHQSERESLDIDSDLIDGKSAKRLGCDCEPFHERPLSYL